MRDRVTIGQTWRRRRDGRPHRVRQVHRADRQVLLVDDGDGGAQLRVSFTDLRRLWIQDCG